MDNNTEQLKVLAEVFNTDKIITSDQIEQVLTGILGLLVRFKKENESLNNDTKTQVESILESIYKEHDRILKSVENSTQNVKSEATEAITKAISEMKRMCAEVMEMKPKDGEKGEDADEEKIIEEVLAKIKLPEYKEVVLDDGAEIISKINDEKVAKINASQIEGLPTFEGKPNGGGWRNLNQLHDVNLSNLANNDVLKYNSTTELWENGVGGGGATAFTDLTDVPSSYTGAGGKVVAVNVGETGLEFISASGVGTVTSVAATVPTGLTISGSPVTTSGTLAIALDTGYVIPLQTTLDAKLDGNGTATYVPFYADANTLESDSHFFYNKTTDVLHVHGLSGDATDGLLIESDNGTDIGILGAGNTANVTWYGSHNFNTATQDTIAAFTGAGKTLGSLATATYPSLTELSYVKGVTSAIQTQLNAKVDDGAVTTSGLTMATSRILGRTTASTGAIEELSTVDSFVSAASDITAGKIEVATTAETNTGTDATRAVSPDGLAGSYAGTKSVSIAVFAPTTDIATGDGKAYITIPEALNGMDLIRAQATVVTAGTTNATTVMIHNVTDAVDMLSGAISIASGGTVGTVGTINTSTDDVATNDVIGIDVDSVSTTAPKGLMVILEFRLP